MVIEAAQTMDVRAGELVTEAGRLVENGRYADAIGVYQAARAALAGGDHADGIDMWLLAAIGDTAFRAERYEEAAEALGAALGDRNDAKANPFVHLRFGQCEFEGGRLATAAAHLSLARALGGPGLFDAEHPKYLQFLSGRLVPFAAPDWQ